MNAAIIDMPIRISKPDNVLLLEVLEDAQRQGYILITDGRELRYTLPNHALPKGWTRFAMTVKPRIIPAREPRA